MMTRRTDSFVLTLLMAVALMAGCGEGRTPRALVLADSLMNSRPDSALAVLDGAEGEMAGEHQRRLWQLLRLNAINKLDTVFTAAHVAHAQTLADYFDRYGTANEQMLAYYLLGRTYADAGEAPRAIDAYNTAANRADTIATDCDYRQLCFVYTQMALLLYQQNLYIDELESLDHAIRYGYLGADTLHALMAYTQKAGAYDMLAMPDSVLAVCETASNLSNQVGLSQYSATMLAFPIMTFLERGDTAKARRYMNIYEKESGYFDAKGEIEHGREVYYYTKGLYYLSIAQFDSAEFFFRKELATGKDLNNQNAGAYGLALLFQQTHMPDSAAKYALYSYAMNDSVYDHEATAEVARMKSLYDYTRHEHEAQQSRILAVSAQLRFVITAVIAVLILTLAVLIAYRYRKVQKKRQEEKRHYQQLLDSYRRTENELSELRTHQTQFSRIAIERQEALAHQQQTTKELERLRQSEQTLTELISHKEQELSRLDAELAHYRRKAELMTEASSDEERLLREFPFYQSLLHMTDQGHSLTANDWKAIRKFLHEHLPQFCQFMSDNNRDLTNYEYQMCMLVRLHLKPKSIANALGVDGSYVTRVRRSMVKKLFGVDVSSKEADILVLQIDQLKTTETAD